MINITEIAPPRKVSGLTSLWVTFNYNDAIVSSMKSMPTFYFHKKELAWEIPINHLAQLLDTLTFLDDIDLKLLNDSEFNSIYPVNISTQENTQSSLNGSTQTHNEYIDKSLTLEERQEFKSKIFKHQLEGINYGLNHNRFLLLDTMGLGKTLETIYLAETLKRRGLIEHCFIICGVNSLKSNWKAEIKKFSNESCLVLGEKISRNGTVSYMSVKQRAEQLKNPIEEFFIITNIETLRNDDVIEAFKKSANKIDMIAVDEIHRCNNKSSQQGHNLLKLSAPYMVAATGTVISSNPISAYLPLAWTGNDHATLTTFKSQYCVFGGFNNSQIIGFKNLDLLREEIAACSIRRTKEDVKCSFVDSDEELAPLPPKILTTELVDMSPEHKKFYEAIKDGVKEEADKIELKSSNLLALTTRLRQATACPSVLTTQNIISSKVERCVELVEDLVSQGEKVVVMSTFKEPLYQLDNLLKQYNPLVCTGDIADDKIAKNVDTFQNCPDYKLLLATHARMGTGFSLNAASYMIVLDEMWTYAQNSQTHDRIHRMNNTRPAFITTLICKDTIDERVHEISEMKKELSDFLIDNIDNSIAESLDDAMMKIIKEL